VGPQTRRVPARPSVVVLSLFLLSSFAASLEAATRTVNAGGDLQAALNAAQPGDQIVLAAGARFTGEFRLPAKPAGAVITVRSSANLPNRRIGPDDASLLPTLVSGSAASALTAIGTTNWRLDGIRFEANALGTGSVVLLQDVKNIVMDHFLFVAPVTGQRRGIAGNGEGITLTRSYLAGIWAPTLQDSQAFCAWDGAGPYTITDNYLEAASENVLFGGADSASPDRVPADILVEGNFFTKRLEWKGQARAVKNLFELKAAKRVTVRNNVFEHNWTDAQAGRAIVFTPRNQDGNAPWSVVEDVLFEYNTVRDTEGVFNILGHDNEKPSGRATRITIQHNLTIGSGIFLLAGGEAGTVVVNHNTSDQGYSFMTLYPGDIWPAGSPSQRPGRFAIESLTVTNNLANHNEYGVFGENVGIGTPALQQLTSTFTWTHNVLAGEQGRLYPYPPITWQPGMAEYRANFTADYRLTPTSNYRRAANDGQDLGVVWPNGPRAPRNLRIQ
jgi:hypothetical protein